MKKILVVLLILSVAWGVFAQDGSWRVSGNVEIGTRADFDPTPWTDTKDDDKATLTGTAYNHWDAPRGRFALIYGTYVNDGSLSTGIKFNTRAGGAENEPFFSYNGENFSFSTALYGTKLLIAGEGQDNDSDFKAPYIKRLWGNYKFVNGLVLLEAAFRGEQQEFWISDTTAGGARLNIGSLAGGSDGGISKTRSHSFFGKPFTFTYTDSGGANYFLTSVNLESLSFGILVPSLFGGKTQYYSGNPRENYQGSNTGYLVEDNDGAAGYLKDSVVGLKFAMAPIEFATQFKMRDAGAYIGARFSTGPVTLGASFAGIFNPEKEDGVYKETKFFKVGGDLNFNGGVFDAGVAASMERDTDASASKEFKQLIRIQPRFSYKVIPSHLCFALDAGFYFYSNNGVTKTTDGSEKQSDITWAVQPQLFWTFLGTGARNGYGWAGPFYQGGPTGFIVRYRVVSAGADWRDLGYNSGGGKNVELGGWTAVNALDVVFQFNF